MAETTTEDPGRASPTPTPVPRWWELPLWTVVVAVSWYLLTGAASLLRDLRVPRLGDTADVPPLPLPLLPQSFVGLAMSALFASVVVALAVRRPWPVVLGTVLAAAAAAYASVRILGGVPEDFFADRRVLVPSLVLLGLAIALGLGVGLWAARRTWRLGIAVGLLAPVASGVILGGVYDLAQAATGSFPDLPSTQLSWAVTALAVGAAGGLLTRYRRPLWLIPVAVWAIVVLVGQTVAFNVLSQVHVGMASGVRDLVETGLQIAVAVLGIEGTWYPLGALVLGAILGVVMARRAEDSSVTP